MKIDCSHDAMVSLSKLKPNPKNNNKHSQKQIERLAKIIDFQGQRSPIIVSNRSGLIVKGHCRLLAMKHLLWPDCAVDYQDYESEEQEYADMTADNEIARWADFDWDAFEENAKDFEDFDMELFGIESEINFGETEEPKNTNVEFDASEFGSDLEHKCPRCDFEFDSKKA